MQNHFQTRNSNSVFVFLSFRNANMKKKEIVTLLWQYFTYSVDSELAFGFVKKVSKQYPNDVWPHSAPWFDVVFIEILYKSLTEFRIK